MTLGLFSMTNKEKKQSNNNNNNKNNPKPGHSVVLVAER